MLIHQLTDSQLEKLADTSPDQEVRDAACEELAAREYGWTVLPFDPTAEQAASIAAARGQETAGR